MFKTPATRTRPCSPLASSHPHPPSRHPPRAHGRHGRGSLRAPRPPPPGRRLPVPPRAAGRRADPVAGLREQRQLHGQQHVPAQPRAPRRGAPQERLRVAGALRQGQRGVRPGHRLRACALPRGRRQRHGLLRLRRHGVPGRAAALRLRQGRHRLLRRLLPPLLQQELPRRHRQQQQRAHPHEHAERELAGRGVRRGRPRAPQRHGRLRGGELHQAVRHGGGGVRCRQPHHLRPRAVHAGHVAGRLPELPWGCFWIHTAVPQREAGRQSSRGPLQFQVRGLSFLHRRPVAAAVGTVVAAAGAASCAS
jgi:hypothetical protein